MTLRTWLLCGLFGHQRSADDPDWAYCLVCGDDVDEQTRRGFLLTAGYWRWKLSELRLLWCRRHGHRLEDVGWSSDDPEDIPGKKLMLVRCKICRLGGGSWRRPA